MSALNMPPMLRYKLRLTPEQIEVMGEYHSRTTLFWNLLHHLLKDKGEAFINDPLTPESEAAFRGFASMTYLKLVTTNEEASLGLSQDWQFHLTKIRELPEDILAGRLMDLVDAYVIAKRDRYNGSDRPTGQPRRKSAKSSQSVRFSESEYEILPGKIKILSVFPMEIEIPGLKDERVKEHSYTLSITRRRLPDEDTSVYGPTSDEDQLYVVTLRAGGGESE